MTPVTNVTSDNDPVVIDAGSIHYISANQTLLNQLIDVCSKLTKAETSKDVTDLLLDFETASSKLSSNLEDFYVFLSETYEKGSIEDEKSPVKEITESDEFRTWLRGTPKEAESISFSDDQMERSLSMIIGYLIVNEAVNPSVLSVQLGISIELVYDILEEYSDHFILEMRNRTLVACLDTKNIAFLLGWD